MSEERTEGSGTITVSDVMESLKKMHVILDQMFIDQKINQDIYLYMKKQLVIIEMFVSSFEDTCEGE